MSKAKINSLYPCAWKTKVNNQNKCIDFQAVLGQLKSRKQACSRDCDW